MSFKNEKQLERHFKGVANHYRIAILRLIEKNEGITLDGITQKLSANFKTMSEHTRKLVYAGLVNKKYRGRAVAHSLSPYGKRFLVFIKSF
ncbi:MAG: ArsR family transcriptional regulator [Candidatus Taylorbacteria bacterium]|nr:ArsR family transcriptional regulator [Candidatus Taylorbacteria bacterium]